MSLLVSADSPSQAGSGITTPLSASQTNGVNATGWHNTIPYRDSGVSSLVKRMYDHAVHGLGSSSGDSTEGFAIIHEVKTESIRVQSSALKEVLEEVFKDYPDWYPDAYPYTFFPPFKPLFHRWDQLLAAVNTQTDETTKREVQAFCEELRPILAPHLAAYETIEQTGVVPFELIWLIFPPGSLVVTNKGDNLCICKLRKISLVQRHRLCWTLALDYIDWNGSYTGFKSKMVQIDQFRQPLSIMKLCVRPLHFTEDQEELQQKLLTRGRKWEALRGYHVQTCIGEKYRGDSTQPSSGRVVVDAFAYNRCQKRVTPDLHRDEETDGRDSEDDEDTDVGRSKFTPSEIERKEDLRPLTDIECILANPRVKGFDLKTKEWCKFNVDDIHEPGWNDTPFEKLVLPEGEKDLILAFADRTRSNKGQFDDFVDQKSQGIVILLCGPPGVGKTLTAEGVAEKSRIPLYVLSAGDLGTSASSVERGLATALECCYLWDAVLLLDEADVFMETRSSDKLERNELVSIFLRQLEYYQGLMFLTTNRIGSIDPAFKSRIDLMLPYYDLDVSARRQVWMSFVGRLGEASSQISEAEFDELANNELNGREIKNSIKTAQILAGRDGPLTMKHLQVVLNIRKRRAM